MTLVPSSPSDPWTFRRVMLVTLLLVLVALSFLLLYRFRQVLLILFISIVIGTVIRPVISWLYLRGVPRIAGMMLVGLLLLALLIGFVTLLVPLIVEQVTTIAASAPDYYHSLREWMISNSNGILVRLSGYLPGTLPSLAPNPSTGQQVMASAGQAWGYVTAATKITFIALVILILAYHWTLAGPRIIRSLLLLAPKEQRGNIQELIMDMETKVGFYLAGQSVLCLVIGILALIAYLLIGLPNALVLALVAGIMEAVPMIGPVLGAVPAGLVAFSLAPSKVIWVIVATLVIQQLENSFLVPRIMRKAVGVNPFVSLLALFAFGSLIGLAGALMAIPMAAILQILLNRFVFRPHTTEAEVSPGRDHASRLRYEVQDLAQDLRKQARLKKGGSEVLVEQIDQVMDEIEALATDLDSLLAEAPTLGASS